MHLLVVKNDYDVIKKQEYTEVLVDDVRVQKFEG